jgi:hypothetical protein
LKLLKVGTWGNTSLVPSVYQKSFIFFTIDNMYIVSQRMTLTFFVIQNSQLAVTNVTCDLSNATINIFVANVAYNLKLVVGVNCKMVSFGNAIN